MDDSVHIKDITLADDELWDLKVSLYDNYGTILDAKGTSNDPDAKVIDDLAHKLCHESISEIEDEVNATGITEYD